METLPTVPVTDAAFPSGTPTDSAATTRLDRDALDASGKRDLERQLRGRPGVSITNSNRNVVSGLFLRGAGSGLGQLTFDDIPLYSLLTGTYSLAALPADSLEQVEVVRGAAAPRYGSRALGGVIRLFSRDMQETGAFARVEGGSFGALQETAGGSLAGRNARVTASFSRDDVFEGTGMADPANGNPEQDDYHAGQGILRFTAQPASGFGLNGSLLYSRQLSDLDGIGLLPTGRPGAVDDRHGLARGETWLAQNTASLTLAPAWDSSLQLGFTQNHTDAVFHVFGMPSQGSFTGRLLLARWNNAHVLLKENGDAPRFTLRWGGEARREEAESRGSALPAPLQAERGIVTGFAEAEAGLGSWSGMAGVHVDRYDDVGTHPVFYAGAAWQWLPALKLHADGGYGFRAPGFNERLSPFYGNPNLRPEQGASGGIGIDWTPSAALRLSLNGFYSRFDDLISLTFVPQWGASQSVNTAHARLRGIEAEWVVTGSHGLSSGMDYSYSDNRDLDTGKALPSRPQNQGRMWGQWRWSTLPVTLWLEGIYRGYHFNDNAQTVRQNDAFRVNAQASYQVAPGLSVYVRGENLNDDRTPEVFNYAVPGAAVYGGFRWQL